MSIPEIQAELLTLRKSQKKVEADYSEFRRKTNKEIERLTREVNAAKRRCDREIGNITKRRAILQGRLR